MSKVNFNLTITKNGRRDANSLFSIQAVVDGYDPVSSSFVMEDDRKDVPFTVDAHVDNKTYKAGDIVIISGKAEGSDFDFSNVEVYLINHGVRKKVITKTDENGNYIAEYNLAKNESGHFIVGACFPNEGLDIEMDYFDVYGIWLNKYSSSCDMTLGNIYKGEIIITNAVGLKQTEVTVTQKSESENCSFSFSAPETISPEGNIHINYTLTPIAATVGLDWQEMPIQITTKEGAVAVFTIKYYIRPQSATIEANVSKIVTTMTKGATREYPIVINNSGKGETGKISLSLPTWMKTATPKEIASLAQGESTTIILRFSPTDDMLLNVPVEGQIGINCENGKGLPIYFSITPISESTGKLILDVVDEYTFYTDESPHVSGAKVAIKQSTTGVVEAEGTTDANGKYSVTLPEGMYSIVVSAAKHESYESQIIIDPGKDTNHTVFLSYQAITYSWDVVETEVEDSIIVKTVVKYDVRVPKPIITVTLPDERPERNAVIPIVVTNEGLINATDVNIGIAISGNYQIEFLNEPFLELLSPRQSETFYVSLNEIDANGVRMKRGSNTSNCLSLGANASGNYSCGGEKRPITGSSSKKWGSCQSAYTSFGGAIHSSSSVGASSFQTPPTPTKVCNPSQSGSSGQSAYSDENSPFDRNQVDRERDKEKEQECNGAEEPVLVYKLIPVTGATDEMNGVAADGVSQVKIVLDEANSRLLPKDDCDNFYDFHWELSRKNVGSVNGDSYKEAIYTAPDKFPDFGSVSLVEATLYYTQRISNNVTYGRKSIPVKIEIIRPPVVFVHGLGDNETCWNELNQSLINSGLYKDGINYRLDYSNTNTSSFDTNYPCIGVGINHARWQAYQKGYISTKCDLVGHSMGGILSRLYIQNGGKISQSLVNRLITVNTPHSGSEVGDAVMAHRNALGGLATQLWYHGLNFKEWNLDAIRDLAVESRAISNLNNVGNANIEIPVYALATQSRLSLPFVLGVGLGTGMGGDALMRTCNPLAVILGILCKYSSHIVMDDISQVGAGDCVVSTESQIGGCEKYDILDDGVTGGAWHVSSPHNYKVVSAITKLLIKDKDDPVFSKKWFHPISRSFSHNNWVLGMIEDLIDFQVYRNEKLIIEGSLGDIPNMINEIGIIGQHLSRASTNDNKEENNNLIKLSLHEIDGFSDPSIIVTFGDEGYYTFEGYDVECPIPSTFSGDAKVVVLMKNEDNNVYYEEGNVHVDKPSATPVSISVDETYLGIGESERIRLYCKWDDGSENKVIADNVLFEKGNIAEYKDSLIIGLNRGHTKMFISYAETVGFL